jgi:exosome complex exonuclease RRP6
VPLEIRKAQEFKALNPVSSKQFTLEDHRRQEESVSLPNPYKSEIEQHDRTVELIEAQDVEPCKYKLLEETPFLFVDKPEQLDELVGHLSQADEIAVDLECHQQRSFQGFTCLMQISTRQRDFVVDTIALRSLIGDRLRPIFDDPTKVKVLHGADHDIQWLQRDFAIYVVNMFDTGQASRVLQLKQFGLAFLLQTYCGVLADKKY